jgi:Ca2+-dependent lipid-binding protein
MHTHYDDMRLQQISSNSWLLRRAAAAGACFLQVRGVDELRVPGQPFQTHDSYCVCSYGDSTVRPRTRVVEDSASPQWNEVGRCV